MKCSDCTYFESLAFSPSGLCRRNPPQITNSDESGKWPKVFPGQWCGEFTKRDEPFEPSQEGHSIWGLELSSRSFNCLNGNGIKTIEELCAMSAKQLLKLRNFGKVSLNDTREALRVEGEKYGMDWKLSGDEP